MTQRTRVYVGCVHISHSKDRHEYSLRCSGRRSYLAVTKSASANKFLRPMSQRQSKRHLSVGSQHTYINDHNDLVVD